MAGGRNPAVLPAGTTVSVRVQQPVTVTVDKEDEKNEVTGAFGTGAGASWSGV